MQAVDLDHTPHACEQLPKGPCTRHVKRANSKEGPMQLSASGRAMDPQLSSCRYQCVLHIDKVFDELCMPSNLSMWVRRDACGQWKPVPCKHPMRKEATGKREAKCQLDGK